MDYYYLNEARQPVGPISAPALAALRQTGVIRGDTLVALDGGEEWRPASVVLPPPIPVLPSRSGPSTSAAPLSRWLAIGGAAVGIILLAGGGVAWALLKKSPSPDDRPPSNPVVSTPETPILGGIDPVSQVSAKAVSEPSESSPAGRPLQKDPAVEHALGEWYEFGYEQGAEIARVFHDFGVESTPRRTQLMQMITNLDVDPESISPPSMRICLEGYEDRLAGKPAKYKPQASQTTTLLPEELRIYTTFAAPAAPAHKVVLEKALACTVLVRVSTAEEEGHGSGFFVAPGLIATNKHVIKDALSVTVVNRANESFKGTVLEVSNSFDFALVGIDSTAHPFLELGDPDSVDVGDEVTAIGFPVLEEWSATTTFGRISSVDRVFFGNPCFQIDLAINHGSSGGPLIDSAGRVIGMNTFILTDFDIERFNFAIKLDSVLPLIEKHRRR